MKNLSIFVLFLALVVVSPSFIVQLTVVFSKWAGYADLIANLLFIPIFLVALFFIGVKTVKR